MLNQQSIHSLVQTIIHIDRYPVPVSPPACISPDHCNPYILVIYGQPSPPFDVPTIPLTLAAQSSQVSKPNQTHPFWCPTQLSKPLYNSSIPTTKLNHPTHSPTQAKLSSYVIANPPPCMPDPPYLRAITKAQPMCVCVCVSPVTWWSWWWCPQSLKINPQISAGGVRGVTRCPSPPRIDRLRGRGAQGGKWAAEKAAAGELEHRDGE